MPAEDLAIESRHALGELSLACTCKRTLNAKEFVHMLTVVCQKLDAAYVSAASAAERRDLERATAALNRAEEEAGEVGLLP